MVRNRSDCKLWLVQDAYINKLASRFDLNDLSRTRLSPITDDSYFQPHDGQASKPQIHEYLQKVGSLLYTTIITRPDLAKIANRLAEHSKNPGPQHLAAVDRTLRYLFHTRFYALQYSAEATHEEAFIMASDAAFADLSGRRSSQGYLCKLFGAAVDWRASKQATVTTSTTEAEFLALSEAGKSIFWWRRLFQQILFDPGHPLSIGCDNAQTLDLLTKPDSRFRTKLRHVDIHHHWLRQEVQKDSIRVHWLPTAQMPADGLTKLLPTQRRSDFLHMLGIVDISRMASTF